MAAHKKHKPLQSLTEKDIARFWKYVEVRNPDECWPWIGCRYRENGYGAFMYHGRCVGSNRIAFFIHNGHDAFPFYAIHSCDWQPCCNPAHLSAGTPKRNVKEAWDRGQREAESAEKIATREPVPGYESRRGAGHIRARLTEAQVRLIRHSYSTEEITNQELAQKYGVSNSTIYAILHRKSWAHIP